MPNLIWFVNYIAISHLSALQNFYKAIFFLVQHFFAGFLGGTACWLGQGYLGHHLGSQLSAHNLIKPLTQKYRNTLLSNIKKTIYSKLLKTTGPHYLAGLSSPDFQR